MAEEEATAAPAQGPSTCPIDDDAWSDVLAYAVPYMTRRAEEVELTNIVNVSKAWRGHAREACLADRCSRIIKSMKTPPNYNEYDFSEACCDAESSERYKYFSRYHERESSLAKWTEKLDLKMKDRALIMVVIAEDSEDSDYADTIIKLCQDLSYFSIEARAWLVKARVAKKRGRYSEEVRLLNTCLELDTNSKLIQEKLIEARERSSSVESLTIQVIVSFNPSNPNTPKRYTMTLRSDVSPEELYKPVIREECLYWPIKCSHLRLLLDGDRVGCEYTLAASQLEDGDRVDILIEIPDPRGVRIEEQYYYSDDYDSDGQYSDYMY